MISLIRQSMINLYCHCQEAFRRRYIENEIIPPAIAMAVGTGVHKAAEINHLQKINSGMDMRLDEIMDAAADGFKNEVEDKGVYFTGSASEMYKELGKAEDLSVKLASVYGRHIAPQIMPVAAELKIQAQHPDLPIPFSGTVDVIGENNFCFDLKTASRKWNNGKERETVQPVIYKWMLHENFNADFEFAFHVVAYDGYMQCIQTEPGTNGIGYVVNIAKAMLNSIKMDCFMPAVPGHWICNQKWCGYYNSCRVRR